MKPTIYIPSELTSLLIPGFLVCRDALCTHTHRRLTQMVNERTDRLTA